MIPASLVVASLVVAWWVLNLGPHFWTRRDPGGSSREGVVVFVEATRWMGVAWGLHTTCRGLRQAGFGGKIVYWRWHTMWAGSLLLPVIMGSRNTEKQARRLATFLERRKQVYPERPVYLVGYSAGGYVAVRALELLADDVCVDGVVIMAGALSPTRDLSIAAKHTNRPLTVCSSVLDWWIIGLGTWLFGTLDRKHTPSVGMVGVRSRTSGVSEIRWHPAMVRLGHWGGHFAASCSGFVRSCVAPALGID